VTAANDKAALTGGVNVTALRAGVMLGSGALAGLTGAALVLGSQTHVLSDGFNASYGFAGIAVALIARNNPIAIVPAALLFAALQQGGGVMETTADVSSTIVIMLEGVVIILVASSVRLSRALRSRRVDISEDAENGSARVFTEQELTANIVERR
jgi:simple sugar transport system permease protein